MSIRSRRVAASTAVLLLCTGALAGCGSGDNSVTTVTHVTALSTNGGKSTARSEVETAIFTAALATGNTIPGGATPAAIARRLFAAVRTPKAATGTSTGTCSNGTKQSSTTASGGAVTTLTDLYYDTACTTLAEEYSITLTNPGTSDVSGAGMLTTYDSTGAVTTSQTLTLSATTTSGTETLTVNDSAATTVGGGIIAQYNSTCVGAPNSTVPACSFAHIGNIAGTEYAESVTTTATAGATAGNASTAISAVYFLGGTLTTALTGTTWGISGATNFTAATGSYGYTTSGANGTVSLTDTLYTFVETATNASGALTLSIVQTTAPTASNVAIGTATIDRFGNGTISYSDGSSDAIHGGFVGV